MMQHHDLTQPHGDTSSRPHEEPEDLRSSLRQILARIHTRPLEIEKIHEERCPRQGASGAEVRMYSVRWRAGAAHGFDCIIRKEVVYRERRVLRLLSDQGQAIPPTLAPAGQPDERLPVFMQYARSRPTARILGDPHDPLTREVAQALARIHAINREQPKDYLPRVADDPMACLYLHATWQELARCLADERFRARYGHLESRLRASLEDLLALLAEWEAEGEARTLLNSDLNPDHIRLRSDGRPVLLDWEQACYGPLYLDLVNYFTLETALLYRDALAEAGHAIPTLEFMERYRAAGRFMGLRYLEVGLLNWQAGGTAWREGRWFFHYCLGMALGGR